MRNILISNKIAIFIFSLIIIVFAARADDYNKTKNKIDSLNQKSKTFLKSNFDSANFFVQNALKLSDDNAYFEGKINALSVLADAHLYLNSMDSAISLSHLIIKSTSEDTLWRDYRFSAFYRLCKIHHYKGEYSHALQAADDAVEDMGSEGESKYLAMVYNLKGLIFKRIGEFEKSNEQFVLALQHTDDNNNYLRSIILTNLGIINRNLEQYTQALDYYKQALECSEEAGDTLGTGLLYQNIAAVYSDQNLHKKSLSYNLLALKIIETLHYYSIEYATLLNNIGLNYEGLKQADSAIKYLNKALLMSGELDDAYGIADTKINIGRVYTAMNKMKAAQLIVEEGIDIARSIEAADLLIEGYEVLIDCQIALNNYKSAFYTQKLLNGLHDSIYSIEKVNAINDLQEKYESEKKEQRIVLLEAENELKGSELRQKKLQRNGLIVFAFLIVLITLIILYYLRKTQQAKNKIEVLQREIHHRVKNNLSIIKRLADVTRQNFTDETSKTAIQELIGRIESMTQVHEQLYQKTDITEVNLNSYLNDLGQRINAAFSGSNTRFELSVDPSIFVGFNKAVPLGLIVNELLTNALKYAKSNGTVIVSLSANVQGDKIIIIVSDNGPGLPEGFSLQKVNSYGLKLVSGLTQQLNGKVRFTSREGTKVELEIPR